MCVFQDRVLLLLGQNPEQSAVRQQAAATKQRKRDAEYAAAEAATSRLVAGDDSNAEALQLIASLRKRPVLLGLAALAFRTRIAKRRTVRSG